MTITLAGHSEPKWMCQERFSLELQEIQPMESLGASPKKLFLIERWADDEPKPSPGQHLVQWFSIMSTHQVLPSLLTLWKFYWTYCLSFKHLVCQLLHFQKHKLVSHLQSSSSGSCPVYSAPTTGIAIQIISFSNRYRWSIKIRSIAW